MIEIDCLGDFCPVPMIKIKQGLTNMESGDSMLVITDHSCVHQNVIDFFKKKKFTIESEEVINGVWEITITKG